MRQRKQKTWLLLCLGVGLFNGTSLVIGVENVCTFISEQQITFSQICITHADLLPNTVVHRHKYKLFNQKPQRTCIKS